MNPLLARLALLTIRSASIQAGYTSPNPVPAADERNKFQQAHQNQLGDSGTFTILHAAKVTKILVHALNVVELVSVLSAWAELPPALSRHALPLTNVAPNTELILGSLLMAEGALLRLVAYRTLGKNFTFQLAIKKDHKLVTHGVYSIVRHPSYTAVCIIILGITLSFLGPRSLYADLGLWRNTITGVVGVALFAMGAYIFFGMFIRMPKEDEALREEFKEEWVAWSVRVPYRLVPYVY